MPNNKKSQDSKIKKTNYLPFFIVSSILLALTLSYLWLCLVYQNKVFHNVYLGENQLSGLNQSQVEDLLSELVAEANGQKLRIQLKDQIWEVNFDQFSIDYQIDKISQKALDIGRDGGAWDNVKTRISLLFSKRDIKAVYDYDSSKISPLFDKIYSESDSDIKDAFFSYENKSLKINPGSSGDVIDRASFYNDFNLILDSILSFKEITINLKQESPLLDSDKLKNIKDDIQKIISSKLVLKSEDEDKKYEISQDQIFSFIDIVAVNPIKNTKTSTLFFNNALAYNSDNYKAKIVINPQKVSLFLESIASDIKQDSQDAKLSFIDGKLQFTQTSQSGLELDKEEVQKEIIEVLLSRVEEKNVTDSINIELIKTDPELTEENVDSYGIEELVASGATSFSGSTSNRIHNITVGAEAFNGLIIKPGETISAIDTIGNPTAETGYLEELVIKGDETKAEYGGGLCQVSTTLFRAALNAGLEIIERTNHLYRVGYYEPPVGMDATIYYPQPDLVIRNNTENYILIQTEVVGTKITFDIFGKKDNRVVTISNPEIYEVSSPQEPKYVQSDSLAEGEIKKLESAHDGAKAKFNYKVELNGETIIEETFISNYQAWQAVYLIGPNTAVPGKCSNECEEGWQECTDDGQIRYCQKDENYCYKWSDPQSCGDDQHCWDNQCLVND